MASQYGSVVPMSFVLPTELATEPGPCKPPIPFDLCRGDRERSGTLGYGQLAEVPQRHHLSQAPVPLGQPIEGVMNGDDIQSLFREVIHDQVQRNAA